MGSKLNKLSRINNRFINSYPIIVYIFASLFAISLMIDIILCCYGECCCFKIDSCLIDIFEESSLFELFFAVKDFITASVGPFIQKYVILVHGTMKCSDYITIYSIVVSLLSIGIAALTMMFGNFKICGINSTTILKYVFKKEFMLCRFVVFLSPVLMLVLMLLKFEFSYFILFALSTLSLIYLSHLCLAVFVDKGIKYQVIPSYIVKELNGYVLRDIAGNTDKSKTLFLYNEFIHNQNNDDFEEFASVYLSVVEKIMLIGNENKMKHCLYRLLKDTKKYMLRNNTDKDDVIRYYFDLCCKLIDDIDELSEDILIIILKNAIECSGIIEVNDLVYKHEVNKLFRKLLILCKHKNKTIDYLLIVLCQIELLGKHIDASRFSNVIFNAVSELIGVALEKSDGNGIEESIGSAETKIWKFYTDLKNVCNGPKEKGWYNLNNIALCVSCVCHDARLLVDSYDFDKTSNFYYESENYCPLFKSEVLKIYCIKKNCVER